ncbi:MAG: bifunctional heptose 7-phosphate kinase/heptose 1-phosphate adenyltransferase, partial [Phycisphaerae bacterium]|nr:bifunctional heptose 7-phosphate kinase/heptose 1-phosphate adenyltransferase [Phycisphaerae bacterium]
MYDKLLKTVTSLGSPRILVVGDFILDSYVYGDAMRISPEAPVAVLKVLDRKHSCGGAASVAADLAALGAKPVCIGVIGNDSNGRILCELLDGLRADVSGLVKADDRPTTNKQRMVGLAQHRHRQQLLRIDDESTDPLTPQQNEELINKYKQALKSTDIVCLQDYNKGVLSEDVCGQFVEIASKAGKRILVDPPMGSDYSKYTGACLITPNRQETSIAVGFDVNTIEDAKRAAAILAEKLKLEAVVVTLDRDGAFLHTTDSSVHLSTIPRNVYDVTGAGDMVLAMLATVLAAGGDFTSAVELSNIAGGIEVEKFGCATVSVEEIVNEIIVSRRGKSGKIHTLETLAHELDVHRHQKEKIVFTNGCFDVLHAGHIEYLKFCKEQGDIVILGLNSDRSVPQLKGPTRPINNQHDRATVLSALESVDFIVIFDEPDPLSLIMAVRPVILVKRADWAEKVVIGREFVESLGG